MDKWTHFLGRHRDAENSIVDAYIDKTKNHLVLECNPSFDGDGFLARTSYLKSYNDKRPQDFKKNNPKSYLINFAKPYVKIEASINLEKAFGSEDAWFAFWLMGPDTWNHEKNEPWTDDPGIPYMCQYDGNKSTGMEIDIMEYAPFIEGNRNNGFNVAAYTKSIQNSEFHKKPTHNSYGYFEDINNHIETPIDITKGFHKWTMIKSPESVKFYIDDQMYWSYEDQKFIPNDRNMGIRFSWEVQRGLWRGKNDDNIPNFKNIGKSLEARIDYVSVHYSE